MELKPGYKSTDAGFVPEDWLDHTVGELIDFEGGSQPDKKVFSSAWKPGYVRLIQIRDYKTDKYETFVPINLARRFCTEKDIMIGRYGPPIFQILRGLSGAYNVALIKALPRPQLSEIFAYYFLKQDKLFAFIEKLSQRSSGQTGVDLKELRNYPLPLPPTKAEQEAIAEALSVADALIESLEQLIAKKRLIKQGAMQELLTGKKRLPGFEKKLGYKNTEVGVIPEDWEIHRLGEGINLFSGFHVLAQHYNTDGDGIAYITGPADFSNGVIQHTKYTTKPGTICAENDILLTVKGSGAGTLVLSNAKYCISRQLMAIRVHSWSSPYIFFSLLQDMSLFGATATGLIPGLSRGDILNKTILLPPTKAEQDAIATILSGMAAELATLETKLVKARQIKQGMMQELLTGRIRLV